MKKRFLAPSSPGLIVRDPHTKQPLPDDGRAVRVTSYYQRRIDCGDVRDLGDAPTPVAKPVQKVKKTDDLVR